MRQEEPLPASVRHMGRNLKLQSVLMAVEIPEKKKRTKPKENPVDDKCTKAHEKPMTGEWSVLSKNPEGRESAV